MSKNMMCKVLLGGALIGCSSVLHAQSGPALQSLQAVEAAGAGSGAAFEGSLSQKQLGTSVKATQVQEPTAVSQVGRTNLTAGLADHAVAPERAVENMEPVSHRYGTFSNDLKYGSYGDHFKDIYNVIAYPAHAMQESVSTGGSIVQGVIGIVMEIPLGIVGAVVATVGAGVCSLIGLFL